MFDGSTGLRLSAVSHDIAEIAQKRALRMFYQILPARIAECKSSSTISISIGPGYVEGTRMVFGSGGRGRVGRGVGKGEGMEEPTDLPGNFHGQLAPRNLIWSQKKYGVAVKDCCADVYDCAQWSKRDVHDDI